MSLSRERTLCHRRLQLRTVSPAGVEKEVVGIVVSTPDDHVAASPDRCVILSGKRRIRGTSGYPTVGAGTVSATAIKIHAGVAKDAAPGEHLAFGGPHRCVRVSRRGCVVEARSHPTIRAWVVSAASIAIVKGGIGAAPDNHFSRAPHRSVTNSAKRRVDQASRRPTVRPWVV